MSLHPPTKPAHALLASDVPPTMDLYCMRCGYNLRGLSGDPMRCPECGEDNVLRDLLLPADRIAKQLKKLETAPTHCFGAVLAASIGFAIVVSELDDLVSLGRTAAIWGPFLIYALIAFPLGVRRFAASCLHQPGWGWALFRFNLFAVAIFALGFGAIPFSFALPASLLGRRPFTGTIPQVAEIFGAVICFILVWVVAVVGIRWCYRRARGCINPLQRQVAVQMYHRKGTQD